MNLLQLARHPFESYRVLQNLGREVAIQRRINEASIDTLRDHARQLAEENWQRRLSGDLDSFTRADIGNIVADLRAFAIKNPLIKRVVQFMVLYTFGQGVTIKAEDDNDNEALQAFLNDRRNRSQITGHQGQEAAERELQITGHLFIAHFAQAKPVPQVRLIPFEEIKEQIANPEDRTENWYYLRRRSVRKFNEAASDGLDAATEEATWHPDPANPSLNQRDGERPDRIGGKLIKWDTPLSSYKIGGFAHWEWGIPPTYAGRDWAVEGTKFLSRWAEVVAALAQWASTFRTKGATQEQLNAQRDVFRSSRFANSSGSETNPPPKAGSSLFLSDQTTVEPFKARGVAPEADDMRQFKLMVAASFGGTEAAFGDAAEANLATQKALDRPTELMILARQEWYKDLYTDLSQWAIMAGRASGRAGISVEKEAPTIMVDFPPVLQHDISEAVTAIIDAWTLKGKSVKWKGGKKAMFRQLQNALGEDQANEIMDQVEQAGGFEDVEPPSFGPPQPAEPEPEPSAAEARYIRTHTALLDKITERVNGGLHQ